MHRALPAALLGTLHPALLRVLPALLCLSACSRENTFTLPGAELADTGCTTPPILDAGPEVLDLGETGNEVALGEFTVSNTGGALLGIQWIEEMGHGVGDDGVFSTTVTPGEGAEDGEALGLAWVLEPGGSLNVSVLFAPNHNGVHWGGVVIATAAAGDDDGPEGVHMARQTARGRVLFTGTGTGQGGWPPEIFLVGGIYPDVYAVEPGRPVRLQWATYDPGDRYDGSPVSYTDQEGDLHGLEGWSIDWTAPDDEPSSGGFARTAGFTREDFSGTEVTSTTPIFVWPTDTLDAPICF
jgi:hypothetical protein